MNLVPVKSIPKTRIKHPLKDILFEFNEGTAKICKIDFTRADYKNARVCRNCFYVAIKNYRLPMKVHIRGKEVYIEKTI